MADEKPTIINCAVCLAGARLPVTCPNGHCFCQECVARCPKKECPLCRVKCDFIKLVGTEEPIFEGHVECDGEASVILTEDQFRQKQLRRRRLLRVVDDYESDLLQLQLTNNTLREKLESQAAQLQTYERTTKRSVDECPSPLKKQRCTRCDPGPFQKIDSQTPASPSFKKLTSQDSEILKHLSRKIEQYKTENVALKREILQLKETMNIVERQSDRFREELVKRSPRRQIGKTTLQMAETKILEKDKEIQRLNRALETSDKFIQELQSQIHDKSSSIPSESTPSDKTDTPPVSSLRSIRNLQQSCSAIRKLDFNHKQTRTKTPVNNDLLPRGTFVPVVNKGSGDHTAGPSQTISPFNVFELADEVSKDSIGPELFHGTSTKDTLADSEITNISNNVPFQPVSTARGFTPIQQVLEIKPTDDQLLTQSNKSAFQRIEDRGQPETATEPIKLYPKSKSQQFVINEGSPKSNGRPPNPMRSLSCPIESQTVDMVNPCGGMRGQRKKFRIGKGIMSSLETIDSDERYNSNEENEPRYDYQRSFMRTSKMPQRTSPNTAVNVAHPKVVNFGRSNYRALPNILQSKGHSSTSVKRRRQSSGPALLKHTRCSPVFAMEELANHAENKRSFTRLDRDSPASGPSNI